MNWWVVKSWKFFLTDCKFLLMVVWQTHYDYLRGVCLRIDCVQNFRKHACSFFWLPPFGMVCQESCGKLGQITTASLDVFFPHFQIWTFWPQEPKNSNLINSFLMHYPQPKMNQKSLKHPKSILILTIKLLYTYFWKMLPVGALIWLAPIWLAWAQIAQPTSIQLKSGFALIVESAEPSPQKALMRWSGPTSCVIPL